ncbi:MAG: tetratricopeptide repeat protein [Spirochaetota bacterium]
MKSEHNNQIQRLLNRAAACIEKGDLDRAESLLSEMLDIDTSNPEALYNLSVLYIRTNKHEDAVPLLQKIIASPLTSVDIIQVKLLLAYSFLSLERHAKCAPLLISILNAVPAHLTALSLLGYYYEKIGNIQKAIETYRSIVSYDADNAHAHNSLAYLLAVSDTDLNGALSSARISIRKDPDNPAYCDTIGYIYMKLGRADMARKFLKNAQQKMPESDIIRQHIHELLRI